MSLLTVVVFCVAFLLVAYFTYGRLLARWFELDDRRPTPGCEMADGVDYVPIEPKFLITQHFSAIAAAGPIVGPILAGVMFGWAPALIWILVGSVFIGGVHDFSALVASVRHKARSIAEVVRAHMTRRSYVLFLIYVWLALVYVVVAFTDITASSFVGVQTLENGQQVAGGAIATSSLLYLALPILMGLLLRYARLPLGVATAIFLPLVGVAIWVGQYIPFDLAKTLGIENPSAQKAWDVLLLVYCFVASIVPMWLLLQPRGHLGGYFLFFALAGGALGLAFGGKTVQYPAFIGWSSAKGLPLFPLLFITIACGACSGFHALVASGTTCKQLKRETDATVVGYGAMLMEGMVAIVSLCCVMMLVRSAPILADPKPNFIYAQGIGSFLEVLGIPAAFGVSFGLMAFTTFVYDTLDVSTRLGRYILQELMGWKGALGRYLATGITAAVPLLFVMRTTLDKSGKVIPAWRAFWDLFGASNQLLAALTLLAVTVWLVKSRKAWWAWLVTGLPMLWMYVMSLWALVRFVRPLLAGEALSEPVPWVSAVLIVLALLLLVEAVRSFCGTSPSGLKSKAAGERPASQVSP
jgi:carbon starvation protein